jgi:hypothetical protein
MSGDDIVRAIETAEILAFPKASKISDNPSSAGGGGDGAPPDDREPGGNGEDDDGGQAIVERMNAEYSLVLLGSGVRIIRAQPAAAAEDKTRILTVGAFSTYLFNKVVSILRRKRMEDGSMQKVRSYVKAAPFWLAHKDRATYSGIEFWPNPDGAPGTPDYYNLYQGFAVDPDRFTPAVERWKKYKTFKDHLVNNIASGDQYIYDWIWAWLAHLIQRPRERIGTALVLRGLQGVGKSTVGDVVGSLLKPHYFLVDDQRYVIGNFNVHMASCTLLQVDEGVWAGDKAAEGRLKGLVTAPKQMIEAKGVDPIQLNNFVRLIFTSNSDWVVPAGMDERRFAVIDVGSSVKENHRYFSEMAQELDSGGREALLADLLAYDLDAPNAPNLRMIPRTQALLEQKIRSLHPIAAWWLVRLENGSQTQRSSGWRTRIPKATLLNDFHRNAERLGVRRKAAETEFGIHMRKLVPGLGEVKSTEEVEIIGDDGRPQVVLRRVRCWIFPSLHECRLSFEDALGQSYDWGEPIEGVREDETA